MDELERALREHGITNVHDVALAVLEVDGSISCMNMTRSSLMPIPISSVVDSFRRSNSCAFYLIGTNFTQTGCEISSTLPVGVRRPVWALMRKIMMLSDFSLAANSSQPVGSI